MRKEENTIETKREKKNELWRQMKIPSGAALPRDVVENIISYVPYDQEKVEKWSWFAFFLLSDIKYQTYFFTIS